MKNSSAHLWQTAILILWLLSVLAIINGGFDHGMIPLSTIPHSPPPLSSYIYPWAGVIIYSIVTAIESALLYLILRPHKFVWSLPRITIAFVVFLILSVALQMGEDGPGYMDIPGDFALHLAFLLFILLIIAISMVVVKHLSKRM